MLESIKNRLELLLQVISSDETRDRILQVVKFTILPEYKTRIFVDGLTTDGNKIGQYSTKPFYQNPNALVGVKAAGVKPQGKAVEVTLKNGKTKQISSKFFKNGNPHKTRYLPQGYKELRELTGRQSETVDLNFSGSLEKSIKVVQDGEVAVIRYTNDDEAKKMTQNEERFGAIISELSDEENEIGAKAASEEMQAILSEIIE